MGTPRTFLVLFVGALTLTASGSAEVRAQEGQADGVRLLLRRLEPILQRGDLPGYLALLTDSADRERALQFGHMELGAAATRAVIQERDRDALAGTLPGEGHRLVVDVFEEYGARGRVATWRLDIKRLGAEGTETEWLIADQERLTSVENLYRLSLNPTKRFKARDLKISAEDLDLTVVDGTSVFVSEADQGMTGVVLLGRGDMSFHPAPETEKTQVKIFCGAETIDTRFDAAYVRINPADFERFVGGSHLVATPVDRGELRRAEKVFREESPKSFNLELGDLSRDSWSLLPASGDLVAEIHTRRFDTLTYARSSSEREDINLFERKRHRNIALYVSRQRLEERRLAPPDEDGGDYDVVNYDIDVTAFPERQWIEGRARIDLKVRAPAIGNLTLRLNDTLTVQSIVSAEYGRLFGIRVKNQNSVVINLPAIVPRNTPLSLTFTYAGRLEPQAPDSESLQRSRDQEPVLFLSAEPSFLYSNRTYWYPQPSISDFATATMRITVPENLDCVASGELDPGSPMLLPAKEQSEGRKVYVFTAPQPVRYLAFLVSRFVIAQNVAVGFGPATTKVDERPQGRSYRTLNLSVATNPRQADRGREIGDRAVAIALFYQSLLDDCPYPSFTVALVENDLPGGHSPGYFAELNQPLPTSPYVWRNDPAFFENYPDFFVAHELAHQWWGQAVGWRNYHEQWLSEGFAQYFAALYAERQRGPAVFAGVMRQMRKWAIADSDQGPISLGYRLGHLRGQSSVFRALVYNKSAAVLHMLRRLVGDEAFFAGVRRFYGTFRFRNAGTENFKEAMEAETGRSLDRFFDQWIYGSTIPRVKFSYAIEGADLVLRVEQVGEIFDLPVTVTLQYAGGRKSDVLVPVTERTAELRVPLDGTLRNASINTDDGTLAQIVKN